MRQIPQEIKNYVARIKNQKKKEYAEKYAQFSIGNTKDHPIYGGSYMGGQAVRMQINSILNFYLIEVQGWQKKPINHW